LLTSGFWNSLPSHVIDVNTVTHWANQDVKYDFTANLTGILDRFEYKICEM